MDITDCRCDIVVVNWNAGHHLRNCINSILKSIAHESINKIFIVDNASSDNSLSLIPDDARIVIIKNNENKGFGVACNQGILASSAAYVVMINPDVEVFENTIELSLKYMHHHRHIDILGGMQLNEKNEILPSCSRFPSATLFIFESLGLSKVFPSIFKPATLMWDFDHKSSCYVDQIMGSFMFIRRSVFERIGYFDPAFFVYFEELDLSKRLFDSGGKSFYNHEIKLIHHGGGTTEKVKAFRLFLSLKSRLVYARKHFTKYGYFVTSFFTLYIECITRIVFVSLKGRIKEIPEILKGYYQLWFKRKLNRMT